MLVARIFSLIKISTVQIYVACVGAALIAAFFDQVRNSSESAVEKTAAALKSFLQSGGSTTDQRIIALLIFAAVACLLVMVYKPKETKESFLLGMSVLVIAGVSAPPQLPKSVHVAHAMSSEFSNSSLNRSFPPSNSSPAALESFTALRPVGEKLGSSGFRLIGSAIAQTSNAPTGTRSVWLLLDGPRHYRVPESRVIVYSGMTGEVVFNSLTTNTAHLVLPAGPNQVEISHSGYRSVSFRINPEQPVSAYKVKLEQPRLDALYNFFGPKEESIPEEKSIGAHFSRITELCRANDRAGALNLFRNLPIREESLSGELRSLLCIPPKVPAA